MSKEYDDAMRTAMIQQECLLEEGWPYPDDDFDIMTDDWFLGFGEPANQEYLYTPEQLAEIAAEDQRVARQRAREAIENVGKSREETEHYRRAHYKGNFDL